MKNKCHHLIETQNNELLNLLQKTEELFDGTLGSWKTYPVESELKQYIKSICSIPYPSLKANEEMFKIEVERLVILGVLEIAN